MPSSLAGKRCLDVGAHDGFWSFEMERRGAAEVVAIDVFDMDGYDYPSPRPKFSDAERAANAERLAAFDVAKQALSSSVRRLDVSVYDLDPAQHGQFDFAVIGTLLLHLRDPIAALRGVARVLQGELLLNEAISLSLTALFPRTPVAGFVGRRGHPFWWLSNAAALRRWLEASGYDVIDRGGPYFVQSSAGLPRASQTRGRLSPVRRVLRRRGMPHAWLLARPVQN